MDILTEKISWTKVLETHFEKLRDVYFEYDYFELFTKSYDVIPEALFWEDENLKIFWSYLIRRINIIELFKDYEYYDLITPYGYGGPLIIKKTENAEAIKYSLNKFFDEYRKFALERNFICEFLRFHPIFKNWEIFESIIDIKYLNDTVALDLHQSYEEIWKNMMKNTRYYTRKALKEFNNYIIVNNPTQREIEDFTKLYNNTMDRKKSPQKYILSTNFFTDHFKFDNLFISSKNNEKTILSAAIFLKGSFIIHYHFGANNYIIQNPPSRGILWKAIEWAKKNGFKWFHFGGAGLHQINLKHFKRGFSKTYLPFYIGKIIFNNKIYDELTSLNPLTNKNSEFFPLYRVGYDDTLV